MQGLCQIGYPAIVMTDKNQTWRFKFIIWRCNSLKYMIFNCRDNHVRKIEAGLALRVASIDALGCLLPNTPKSIFTMGGFPPIEII
jgi:hypothetical protein